MSDSISSEAVSETKSNVYDIVYIGMFAVLIAVCSWISIPTTVPFTLQTFGVFMAAGVLGGRRGTLAVLVYILMGALGLPVFAGFAGGVGILLGSTGGYILGFLFSALIMWLVEKLFGQAALWRIIAMISGLAVCYAFGTIWFVKVYSAANGAVSIKTALGWCVIPFIPADAAKIILAFGMAPRIRKIVRI